MPAIWDEFAKSVMLRAAVVGGAVRAAWSWPVRARARSSSSGVSCKYLLPHEVHKYTVVGGGVVGLVDSETSPRIALALEPESACIACLQSPDTSFRAAAGASLDVGSKVIIVDCGGACGRRGAAA